MNPNDNSCYLISFAAKKMQIVQQKTSTIVGSVGVRSIQSYHQ